MERNTKRPNSVKQHMKRYILCLVAVVCLSGIAEADQSGRQIVERAMNLAAGIQDYTAQVHTSVDMPGMKIPRRAATVYFKRPDKVHVDADGGMVLVPRRAVTMGSLGSEITANSRVQLAGRKVERGIPVFFIKVLPPEGDNSKTRLLLWIRGDRFTVEKMEVHDDGRLMVKVEWTYQQLQGRYWLPRQITATVPRGALPVWGENEGARRGGRPQGAASGDDAATDGTITMQFSNVRVNTGLSDSIFKSGS